MITEATIDDIDEILEFSWKVQSHIETASYPMYESIDDMRTSIVKILNHKDDKLLVCRDANGLIGAVNLFVESKINYLQTTGIYAKQNSSLFYSELIAYIANNYHGCEFLLGYPKENTEAAEIMHSLGAECIESSVFTHLEKDDFSPCATCLTVQELTIEKFDEFAPFHDTYNSEMSWTSERIKEGFEKWKIFITCNENQLSGCILYGIWNEGEAEIYAVSSDMANKTEEFCAGLLSETLPSIFSMDKKKILYMVEDGSDAEFNAALKVGFKETYSYRCYRILV